MAEQYRVGNRPWTIEPYQACSEMRKLGELAQNDYGRINVPV